VRKQKQFFLNQGSADNKARPCAVTKEKQTLSAEELKKLKDKTAVAKQRQIRPQQQSSGSCQEHRV